MTLSTARLADVVLSATAGVKAPLLRTL